LRVQHNSPQTAGSADFIARICSCIIVEIEPSATGWQIKVRLAPLLYLVERQMHYKLFDNYKLLLMGFEIGTQEDGLPLTLWKCVLQTDEWEDLVIKIQRHIVLGRIFYRSRNILVEGVSSVLQGWIDLVGIWPGIKASPLLQLLVPSICRDSDSRPQQMASLLPQVTTNRTCRDREACLQWHLYRHHYQTLPVKCSPVSDDSIKQSMLPITTRLAEAFDRAWILQNSLHNHIRLVSDRTFNPTFFQTYENFN
jgi:hypothetical protein